MRRILLCLLMLSVCTAAYADPIELRYRGGLLDFGNNTGVVPVSYRNSLMWAVLSIDTLGPSWSNVTVTPRSWEVFNGWYFDYSFWCATCGVFKFSTDSQSHIIDWNFTVDDPLWPQKGGQQGAFYAHSSLAGDSVVVASIMSTDTATNSTPGAWEQRDVPEPPLTILLGIGIGGVYLLYRKRKEVSL